MTEEEFKERIRKERDEEYEARGLTMIIFVAPIFLAIDVLALGRPFFTSIGYSLSVAAIILVAIVVVSLLNGISRYKKGDGVARALVKHQSAILQITAAGFAYYTIGAAIHDFYRYLESPESEHVPTVLVTVVGTLSAGCALFIFRIKKRLLYGITEIMVGVIVASYRVTASDVKAYLHPEFYLVLLTAGVYLVVRGMDNIHQAIKAPRRPQKATESDTNQDANESKEQQSHS